jgi:hypothetical protein
MRKAPSLLIPCLLLAFSTPADARKPEDVFAGKIILSTKAFPITAKSPDAYISAVRKQSVDKFQEDKEKKQWKIFYVAFFKRPVDDLEVTVKFIDVTDGNRRMVESYEQYLTQRKQRVITGDMRLRKDPSAYDPNSKIIMQIESKGSIVAQTTFTLEGEGPRYKGQVSFDEDETGSGEIPEDEKK